MINLSGRISGKRFNWVICSHSTRSTIGPCGDHDVSNTMCGHGTSELSDIDGMEEKGGEVSVDETISIVWSDEFGLVDDLSYVFNQCGCDWINCSMNWIPPIAAVAEFVPVMRWFTNTINGEDRFDDANSDGCGLPPPIEDLERWWYVVVFVGEVSDAPAWAAGPGERRWKFASPVETSDRRSTSGADSPVGSSSSLSS